MKTKQTIKPAEQDEPGVAKGICIALHLLATDDAFRPGTEAGGTMHRSRAYRTLACRKDVSRYLLKTPNVRADFEGAKLAAEEIAKTMQDITAAPVALLEQLKTLQKELDIERNKSHLHEGKDAEGWYKELRRMSGVLTTDQIIQLMTQEK